MRQNQLGVWLRHFREAAGLTQKQVSDLTTYDHSAVSRFERGLRQPPQPFLDIFITSLAPFLTFEQREAMAQHIQSESPPAPIQQAAQPSRAVHIDWGDMLDIPVIFGRQKELSLVETWLKQARSRFVSILGIGGIGKTVLAMQAAKKMARQFDYVVWRSLRYAPTLDELLQDLLHFLYYPDQIVTAQQTNGRLRSLVEFFRQHKCLLILDNTESILDSEQAGHYRSGYANYEPFIDQLSQREHQSTVIMTSREIPRQLSYLDGEKSPARTLHLSGLPFADGSAFLVEEKRLKGADSSLAKLMDHYSGNPLALTIVADMIREIYGGQVEEFLLDGDPIFGGIHDIIKEQFDRLSQLEQSVLCWLAIEREPATIETLGNNIVPIVKKGLVVLNRPREISIALRSLRRRSLVEATGNQFFLQHVIAEFVTNHVVDSIEYEIENNALSFFLSHALLKAESKEYIRDGQLRLLVQPVLQRLLSKLGSIEFVGEQLLKNFAAIRGYLAERRLPNYAASNTLHLLHELGYSLANLDFSEAAIWQADLRKCQLHHVNFQRAHLRYSAFAEGFSSVLAVGLSPDGNLYAAGTENGEIRLWSVATNRLYHVFHEHSGWVRAVVFSPDGRFLISGGDDQTIKVWNTRTKRLTASLTAQQGRILSLAISSDSSLFASGSSNGSIMLWQTDTQQPLGQLSQHTGAVWSVAFNQAGTLLASGSDDEHVYIWDVATHQPREPFRLEDHKVRSVAFIETSQMVAAGNENKTLVLWDLATGEPKHILRGHEGRIKSIAVSSNGRLLASGSEDRSIRLWDANTGRFLRRLQPEGDAGRIVSVAFHMDSRQLISGSQDRFVRIWDVETGQCLRAFHGYHNWVRSVAFSQNGHLVASGNQDQTVVLWNTATNESLKRLQGHANWVWTVAFSPDDKFVASGSQDKTIKLWDVETGTCLMTYRGHHGRVMSLAFHNNGRFLVSGSIDNLVKLWDVASGTCIRTLVGHRDRVRSVTFSPNGHWIASGSEDQTVKLWNAQDGRLLATFQGHINRVTSVAFHPSGTLLGSSSYDRTIKIWDLERQECQQTIEGHTDLVMSLAFSPDGTKLASCSLDKTVRVWDVASGRSLWSAGEHTSWVRSVAFSPNGMTIVSASDDETIRFWDAQSGNILQTLRTIRPYERLNITGISGVTEAQRQSLLNLGAVDENEDALSW